MEVAWYVKHVCDQAVFLKQMNERTYSKSRY